MIPPQLITAGIQLLSPVVNKLLGGEQQQQQQRIDTNTQANLQNTQQLPGQELQAGNTNPYNVPLQQNTMQQQAPPMTQQVPLQTTQTNQQNNMLNNGMNMMGGLLPLLLKNKQQGIM